MPSVQAACAWDVSDDEEDGDDSISVKKLRGVIMSKVYEIRDRPAAPPS